MYFDDMKIVEFDKYCPYCKNRDTHESEEPCCECLATPVIENSHKPLYFEESLMPVSPIPGSFTSKRKIKNFFYGASYNFLDYKKAKLYFEKEGDLVGGACTALRKGKYIGRNFDWTYDNAAEFLIRVDDKYDVKYSSVGIAGGLSKLTEQFVSDIRNDINDAYAIIPFMLRDGVNENHVFAEMNVVPRWNNSINASNPFIERRESISCLMLVRYILDNFSSARRAVEYIRDYVSVYFSKTLHNMNYEIHYMVADLIDTFCLEFVNGQCKIIDISNNPYITNFHLNNVVFNSDGTVYTPATQDATHNAFITNHVELLGSGLERYNYIVKNYDNIEDVESMWRILDYLNYTHSYLSNSHPGNLWLTEFVDAERNLTVTSSPSDYQQIMSEADLLYLYRNRSTGKTWHTMHSVIYDIENLTMHVKTQEIDRVMEI